MQLLQVAFDWLLAVGWQRSFDKSLMIKDWSDAPLATCF
jgi:hypothetical protein